MNNYAIFVPCDMNYLHYLNALLNSIDKRGIDVDFYLIHKDFPQRYIKEAQSKLSFPVIPIEMKQEHFDGKYNDKEYRFVTDSRFKYIQEIGTKYEAVGILDADMFVVSPNILNLFELVKGTKKLIAANELFKWVIDKNYTYQGKPVLKEKKRLHKFHCTVPTFFVVSEWNDVIKTFNEVMENIVELNEEEGDKIPDSLFTWNISVYINNRQDDIILMPVEILTQCHYTNLFPNTRLDNDEGTWLTGAGLEVFIIHGQIAQREWIKDYIDNIPRYLKEKGIVYDMEETPDFKKKLVKTLEIKQIKRDLVDSLLVVQKEWYDLNFNHKINLYDYCSPNEYWDSLKELKINKKFNY